jgi:geranylgeranyl pyrophosphate synthase
MDAVLGINRAPKHLIRAQLVLLGAIGGDGDAADPGLERFATGVELLHLSLVLRDDALDNATLRRGKPTLRVALQQIDPSLGWQGARDLGMVMSHMIQVLAMRHLMPEGSGGEARACGLVLEGLARAGAGHFRDLLGWRRLGEAEAALRQTLIDKTAYEAFAAPFAAGLVIARADADERPAIAWGCRMGLAFQVIDHLADLIAPPLLTGKDTLRALLEGRPSLPLFLLRARATEDDRELLAAMIGRGSVAGAHRAELHAMVERYRVVEACAEYVRREIAASSEVSRASFTALAGRGMDAVERGLTEHLSDVIAASP